MKLSRQSYANRVYYFFARGGSLTRRFFGLLRHKYHSTRKAKNALRRARRQIPDTIIIGEYE